MYVYFLPIINWSCMHFVFMCKTMCRVTVPTEGHTAGRKK